jgi:hypothetical protein
MMLFCLLSLNAQEEQNADMQPTDSIDMKNHDSILLQRINPEDMFRKRISKLDSSSFDKKAIRKQLKAFYPDFRQWRFGINGGFETIIAPEPTDISPELSRHRKSLKSGPRFGADVVFFISPNIGIGVNYSTFGAEHKTDNISYEISGNTFVGERQDNIRIHFAGPTIDIRSIPKSNKFYISCDFTLGYFVYLNDLVLNNKKYDLTEGNFGFATSIGADFMITKNMSVGLSLNITAASIKKAKLTNDDTAENLSRISVVTTLKTYK